MADKIDIKTYPVYIRTYKGVRIKRLKKVRQNNNAFYFLRIKIR